MRIGAFQVILAAVVLGALGGCTSTHAPPGPLVIPSAQTQTICRLGTPLSGPRPGNAADIDFADRLDVQVTWFALERFDGGKLPLLGSQASLIAARLGGLAVLPSARLTQDGRVQWGTEVDLARLLNAASPARKTQLSQSYAALPMGVTDCFRAIDSAGPVDRTLDQPELRYIEIDVARQSATSLRIAACVQDSPTGIAADGGPYQFESAIFDHDVSFPPRQGASEALLLMIPFQFTGPPNRAAAVLITFLPPQIGAPFHDAVVACQRDLQNGQSQEISGPAWTLGLERAVGSLDSPTERRAALVYLASQTEAKLCQDVAGVCDDTILAQIAGLIRAGATDALKSNSVDEFSWLLDRSTIQAMQGPLFKSQLSPELLEILTLYMGETGRHAAALDEVMRGVTSRGALEQRLVSENYIYLQDSSPAYRARAYDWLKARNLAPANFDPLGTPRQRREALDQALSTGSTAPAAGGTP